MNCLEKYKQIFCDTLQVTNEELENCTVQNCDDWDSFAQITMISLLEKEFGIVFLPDDIMNFNSYLAGINILIKRGVIDEGFSVL